MPVMIRGEVFPSAAAAADHFGIDVTTVYGAVANGRADQIGLGRGKRPKENRKNGRAREFAIGGVTYPSMADASEALGFARNYLAKTLRVGKERAKARVLRAAMAASASATSRALKASEMADSSQCGTWHKQKRAA